MRDCPACGSPESMVIPYNLHLHCQICGADFKDDGQFLDEDLMEIFDAFAAYGPKEPDDEIGGVTVQNEWADEEYGLDDGCG